MQIIRNLIYLHMQTNVIASAQRRKMRGFGDFKRLAVIIIPEDEEYKRRVDKNKETNVYTVSESTENEMKGLCAQNWKKTTTNKQCIKLN